MARRLISLNKSQIRQITTIIAAVLLTLGGITPLAVASDQLVSLQCWQAKVLRNGGEVSTGWQEMQRPELGLPREFQGRIDYRTTFQLTVPIPDEPLGVFVGQIGDVDRVYVNDNLIGETGSFPPDYRPYLDLYREYLLPPYVLRKNAPNELRIETYVEYVGLKGINTSSVEIGPHKRLQGKKYAEELFWYLLKIGLPSLCLFMSLLSMPWTSAQRQFRPNILLFLTGLSYCIFGLGKSRIIFHFLPPLIAYKFITLSALSGLVFIFIYSLDLCRIRKKWPYALAIGIPLIFAIRILFGQTLLSTSLYVKDWLLGSIPLLLVISCSTIFLARDKSAWVRVGLTGLAIVAINDVLNAVHLIHFVNLMDLGFSIFILSMLISQMVTVKKGWVGLSKREADLLWSSRFMKMARQVGHDIKSPLSSANPALEELENNVKSSVFPGKEAALNSIEILRFGMQRMNSMSGKVLAEYKTMFENETTEDGPALRLTLVDKVFFDVVNEARATAPSHISFTVKGFSAIPNLWGVIEVGEIQTAVANILKNSIEAMANVAAEKATVCVTLEANTQTITLKIADQGVGIPENIISSVFDEGFTHGKEKGTGLGLAQAKKAISLNDGKISVESQQGDGTIIKIELPRESSPKWLKSNIRLSSKRPIHFIDDDPSILAFWRDRMRAIGNKNLNITYQFSFESVPQDGLRDAILIMDYNFKNARMTGLEWLRKQHPMPEAYLCTTAYDEQKIQEEVKALGIALIPKPMLNGIGFRV